MAVRFDASNDFLVYSGTGPDPATTGFTVTLWAYIDVDLNDYSTIFRYGNAGGSTSTVAIETEADGQLLYAFAPAGSQTLGIQLSVGGWYRVAYTIATNGTGKFYMARPADATATVGAQSGVTNTQRDRISIGGRPDNVGGEWWNGRAAYVRVWSTTLTQAEIEAEWASPTPVKTSGLFSNWPLADATDLTDATSGKALVVQGGSLSTATGPDVGPTSISGALAGSLPAMSGSLAGTAGLTGATAGSLPTPDGSLTGIVSVSGLVAGTLPPPGGALAGAAFTPGSAAGALPTPGGSLTGSVGVHGQMSGELVGLTGALTGLIRVSGAFAGSLPRLGGSFNDVVTLLTQDEYALDVHRENTKAFIDADPFSVTLRTRTAERTPLGGVIMTDGTFRSPQVGKLIMISPAGGSIEQRTDDGTERQVDYILLMEWDAEIAVGDWWDDNTGNRWEVKALIPTNNYETRAVVEAHGKVLTGG